MRRRLLQCRRSTLSKESTKLWVLNSSFWNGVVASRRSPSYDGTLRAICVLIPPTSTARDPGSLQSLRATAVLTVPPHLGSTSTLFPFIYLPRYAPGSRAGYPTDGLPNHSPRPRTRGALPEGDLTSSPSVHDTLRYTGRAATPATWREQ